MTVKFKQIIEQLNALITFKSDKSISDEDCIANIDAVNILCNLCDDIKLDCSAVRRRMSDLYAELYRRIYGKSNIQHAMPLIRGLNNLIYGRGDDFGPAKWRDSLIEMCSKVVETYRQNPLIDSIDYLFALDVVCRTTDVIDSPWIEEYKNIIDGYLNDIATVPLSEQIKRVRAYNCAKQLFVSDNWQRWAEVCELLKKADISLLDDQTFILWCEITDTTPIKELKKRCGHCKQMCVQYMQGLIFVEFTRVHRASVKSKLARELNKLNDNLICDIINLKIDSSMSVSTIHALETIFYLRLQLAQVCGDDNESIYNSLCHDRFEQLATALRVQYDSATSLNDKIEILERLVAISVVINSDHFNFAIEEADELKGSPCLTYAQKLRLDWLPSINSENESEIVADLLQQNPSSFEMATIALITDFITTEEREAVFNRYFDLFDAALATGNVAELGKLLALSANWNSDPTIRPRLTQAAAKVQAVDGLTLPERRVSILVAEIYTRIDGITG